MKLNEIKPGEQLFVDSNIFIYHFTGVSDECTAFLSRCETGELIAVTSVNVILEVLHRLLMIEAVRKELVQPPNIVKKISKHPEKLKQLNEYYANTEKIKDMGIQIQSLKFDTIVKSHMVRLSHGLMVNDSVIVASMQENAITFLATADKAFEKVAGIEVCRPNDVDL